MAYFTEEYLLSSILQWVGGKYGQISLNKAHGSDSIEPKIAKFLATYRATPHSVTGRALTELLLGRLPRTRLSLIHPCVSQRLSLATEQRVGNRSPRVFKVGQAVLLQDFHPTTTQKWRAAFISA